MSLFILLSICETYSTLSSIKLRVRKEVLNDISESEEKEWKLQISNERTIRFIAEKQQPNGWIGLGFHGGNKNAGQFDNQEVGV